MSGEHCQRVLLAKSFVIEKYTRCQHPADQKRGSFLGAQRLTQTDIQGAAT
jgi:hypothetical protein